jgi:protein Tex
MDLASAIAKELALPRPGVERTLALFAEGATIPFVARYRKEVTGHLDEVQLGKISERAEYLTELEARRATILASISEQGKLTDDLRRRIEATASKTELEDLYLPYKPKRRTRAMIAREKGLEPLADQIWAQGRGPAPEADDESWQGARDIVAERIADDADVRAVLREQALRDGALASRAVAVKIKGKEQEGAKFQDYFDYREPAKGVRRTACWRSGAARTRGSCA